MVTLQHPCIYRVVNLFPWMISISLLGKMNFFEKCVGEYAKSGVGIDTAHQEFRPMLTSNFGGPVLPPSS
jgi:hypothetical protein